MVIFCDTVTFGSMKPICPGARGKAKGKVWLTGSRKAGTSVQHHSEPPPSAHTLQSSALTHLGVRTVTSIPRPSIFGRKKINVFTKDQPVTLYSCLGFFNFGVLEDL